MFLAIKQRITLALRFYFTKVNIWSDRPFLPSHGHCLISSHLPHRCDRERVGQAGCFNLFKNYCSFAGLMLIMRTSLNITRLLYLAAPWTRRPCAVHDLQASLTRACTLYHPLHRFTCELILTESGAVHSYSWNMLWFTISHLHACFKW